MEFVSFLDEFPHLNKRVRPSIHPCVRWSVRRSVEPSVRPFPVVVDDEKSSIAMINNATMNDDEEVASDVPPRY